MTAWAGLLLEALRLDRWPASRVTDRAGAALEAGVGGFVLFGGEADEVRELTRELRRTAGRPLWMASDLERGAGQQFGGALELPPPAALAAHPRREEAVRLAGGLTGRDARDLGINWVLAPVLDLDIEPRNPIVGTRSFGTDPHLVARLGRIWIDACQAEGVAACAKHFPGHGRSLVDSHVTLPVVSAPRPVLERDLEPFRAVAGAVASVMVAHVAYPALGADGPATFAPSVLAGLLRRELGFEGIVASDAMTMAGFRGGLPDGPSDEGHLAARAVAAGCDVLLYPEDLRAASAGIAAAAERDPEFAARAQDARRRSLAACERYSIPEAAGNADSRARGHPERILELAIATVAGSDAPGQVGLSAGRPTRVLRLSEPGEERLEDVVEVGGEAEDARRPDELPEGTGRVPAGAALADELRSLGWPLVGADDPAVAQTVLVVDASPRAWRDRTRFSAGALEALRGAAEPGPAWTVVLGHARVLSQIGLPGCWAWEAGTLMQRAAARWLDARLR